MRQEILFQMRSPLRDTFKIQGFRFGSGQHSLAIVGAMRGDEIEQQYICACMVRILAKLEREGRLEPDQEILVVPNANHFSMNIAKRFWAMDDTDINRMFPGYELGETTQRIAAGLFEAIKDYTYGIQLASYYIPGAFIPHIRMMETGYQPEEEALRFGLPYVYVKSPHPYDTTILNYNWQIWNTKAFSLYSGKQDVIDEATALNACRAMLRFMERSGIIRDKQQPGFAPDIIHDSDLTNIKADSAGILFKLKSAAQEVLKGEELARILDPYTTEVLQSVRAPVHGTIFFAYEKPLVLQNTLLYKIIVR